MDVREKAKNGNRLIDANAFLKDILTAGIGKTIIEYSESDIGYMIRKRPTVDAVEVVHAEWLYDGGSGKYFCSACDADALSFKKDALYGGDLYEVCLTDYCPSCGAKMDGGNG